MSTQHVYVFPDIRRVEKEEIQQNIFKLEFHEIKILVYQFKPLTYSFLISYYSTNFIFLPIFNKIFDLLQLQLQNDRKSEPFCLYTNV